MWAEAEDKFEELLKVDPEHQQAADLIKKTEANRIWLAELKIRVKDAESAGDLGKAILLLEEMIPLSSDEAEVISRRKQLNDEIQKSRQLEIDTLFSKAKSAFDARDWAGFQIAGFQGMTGAEEQQFAVEQLEKQVGLAYISSESGDWNDALKDYEKALIMAQTIGNKNYVNILQQQIIQTAINGRNFSRAIAYQENILADAEFNRDTQKINLFALGMLHRIFPNK